MILKYNANDKFNIGQLTDLHFKSLPFNDEDKKTEEDLKKVLSLDYLDLIVITGDLIDSRNTKDPLKTYRYLINLFNKYEKYVILIPGNHDTEKGISRMDLINENKKLDRIIKKDNYKILEDRENYTVDILDNDNKAINTLYIMDSGSYNFTSLSYYAFINFEQIDWIRSIKSKTKNNILFMHIPLVEYKKAEENTIENGVFEESEKTGRICSADINTGLFAAIKLYTNINHVFVGHDHNNNFTFTYKDIKLSYGNISGYGTYGHLKRGFKLITLDKNLNKVISRNIKYEAI